MMCWDWNAEDIDSDEDDRRMWVPITPKTMEEEGQDTRKGQEEPERTPAEPRPIDRMTNAGQGPDGNGHIVTPAKQGEHAQKPNVEAKKFGQRDEAMSELTALTESDPEGGDDAMDTREDKTRRKRVILKMGRSPTKEPKRPRVPKGAAIVTAPVPRPQPCDRCRKMNRACHRRLKGGQPLTACAECYNQKMSCKTTDGEPSGHGDEREEDTLVEKVQSENKHGEDNARTPRKPRWAAVQA